MKLQPDNEARAGVVVGFDQSVRGACHRLEARSQAANALMMVAVHVDRFSPVPPGQWTTRHNRQGMAVHVAVLEVDVLESGPQPFLDVAVQRSSADDVHELRSPTDGHSR
jgi:hypothetical protein